MLSRYHNIAGRDWIAIPLIPYLYAVDRPENIPLYVDSKMVRLLRHQYIEKLANSIGEPGEDSYQLAGSAYDRTLYGFRVATRPDQDARLIEMLNSSSNQPSYRLLSRNCADFVKAIINFYYPNAVHRSVIADLGVMTPKQAAKSLVHASRHHPEMQLTTFIIPQVPGLKRSKPVHGIIESLVLAKKYVTPVLLFHPFLVGGVEAAYWAGWRFDPARGALIFDPANGLEPPLTSSERRHYQKSLAAAKRETLAGERLPSWRKLEARAQPVVDPAGAPFLEMEQDGQKLRVGVCRDNALRVPAPPELVEDLMVSRLEQELKPGKPAKASRRQVAGDWRLLEQAAKSRQASVLSVNGLAQDPDKDQP
ncbi:MAG TPA: hypothetical protein VM711_00460 [Sphingomicrobium sp.]|nr:hypothetical protein [Sphingomicrobium sp.]